MVRADLALFSCNSPNAEAENLYQTEPTELELPSTTAEDERHAHKMMRLRQQNRHNSPHDSSKLTSLGGDGVRAMANEFPAELSTFAMALVYLAALY